MNIKRRVTALVLAFLLVAGVIPVSAAEVVSKDGEAVVVFEVSRIYSLTGTISIEDEHLIVESYDFRIADNGGMKGGNINGDTCFLYETANPALARTVKLEVVVRLKSTAAKNQKCTVTLTYEKGVDEKGLKVEPGVMSMDVVVGDRSNQNVQTPDDDSETNTSTDPTTATDPSDPVDTDPTNPTNPTTGGNNTNTNNTNTNTSTSNKNNNTTSSNKTNTSTKETEPAVDYSKLEKQIQLAEGLKKEEFPEEDWKKFSEVLEEAKKLADSKEQEKVDEAADKLQKAIATLVGVDYTRLRAALDAVADASREPVLSALWYQMLDLLNNAEELMDSIDQAAVDQGAVQIEELLEAIKKAAQEIQTDPQTVVEQVPVEVTPGEEYCNVGIHKLWPILFFVSLAINVALAVIIVIYLLRLKKNRQDDTPLVDYDISDDELDALEELESEEDELEEPGL